MRPDKGENSPAANPIPGHPGMLKDLALRLRRGWETLRDTRIDTTRFLSVENDSDWNSDAAEAFRTRAGEVPRALGHAEARFWGTAYHLHRYAEELEAAQRDAGEAQGAIDRAKRVQERAADDWGRLSRTEPDSDAAGQARRDLTSANETIGLMSRSLQQAIHRAHEAATRCVAAIGQTIQDPLRGLGPLAAYSPFANQVSGRDPRSTDLDLARLAQDAYDLGPSKVAGWRKLSPEELAAIGLSPSDLKDPHSGFRAAVYESNGRYVVAYAGTDPGDWGLEGDVPTDVAEGLGLPTEQYARARRVANRANAAFGKNLAFTGHSLGGGLASAAALDTGKPAVTFNAAGLSDNTLGSTIGSPSASEARQRAANGLVRSYHVKNEPLSSLQEGSGIDGVDVLPDAVGHRIELSEPGFFSKVTGHGSGTVIESMERDQPWAS